MTIDAKIYNKELADQIQQCNKRSYTMIKWDLVLGCKMVQQICKSISVIHHIKRLKEKNSMIISIGTQKAFNKIQNAFMIKIFNKLWMKGTYLNIIKPTYFKSTANIILNVERLKAFVNIRNKTRKSACSTPIWNSTRSPS